MMAVANGKKPHVLAVPLPLQGHVKPLMKLCHQISNHGIKVTFVNTEYIHDKFLAATSRTLMSDEDNNINHNNLVLTSIPDGLRPEDDRTDHHRVFFSLRRTMADDLTDLIEKINRSNEDEQISCLIADFSVGWVLEVAGKIGAEAVGFVPFSAATLAMALEAPKLFQQGLLDADGSIKGCDGIILSDDIPPWRKDDFVWSFPYKLKIQKKSFRWWARSGEIVNDVKWLLCNTSYELESSACNLIPNLLSIGHLPDTTSMMTNSSSSYFREDTSCISWLNDKPTASVIYVSFGSIELPFSQRQIAELALGLQNSGRTFLWVLRSDLAKGFPDGFLERSSMVGKIVEWAPQEKVLLHPSVACFLSHCGWNSTLEGLISGVPFLCWPYFTDQFHNRNYICDKWGNGLRIECGENDGLRTRHEIKTKIDMLFSDYHTLKANALTVKATITKSTVHQGGSYSSNLQKFIQHLKIGSGLVIPSKY